MNSDGSSSESDVSVTSGESTYSSRESTYSGEFPARRRTRRDSVNSVCTQPTDDVYVMVLQNRKGLYDDLKCVTSVRDLCDVTFLVGEERRPVHGIRAIIATRSRLFYQLILSHEKNKRVLKESQKSKLRKTLSKITKLACVRPSADDSMRAPRTAAPRLVIPMVTFDPETFERFMNYIHCGTLAVNANTVIGTLNAAYMFGFPEVQQACWDFAVGCAEREDNLCDLFRSAGLYDDHKMTRNLMRTVSKRMREKFAAREEAQVARETERVRDARRERETEVARDTTKVVDSEQEKEAELAQETEREQDTERESGQARASETEANRDIECLRDSCEVTVTAYQKFPDLLANHKLSEQLDTFDEGEEDLQEGDRLIT